MKEQIIVKKGEFSPVFDAKTQEIVILEDPYFSIVAAIKELTFALNNIKFKK